MRALDEADLAGRLALDMPWRDAAASAGPIGAWPRRDFLDPFVRLLDRPGPAPPVLLAGPRRTGKTVLLRQAAARLIDSGLPPRAVAYADLDAPALQTVALDTILRHLRAGAPEGPGVVLLDSLHRRPDTPRALAVLAAAEPGVRFAAALSAGPAPLRRGGGEGCTPFILPPLTFGEYLNLSGSEHGLIEPLAFGKGGRAPVYAVHDMDALNRRFLHYINAGGFPESVLLPPGHGDGAARLRGPVLDALLHGDLPALAGIGSGPELTALFTLLARNTGAEVSIEAIAVGTGLAKNTVRRHLDWLEAAFLIVRQGRLHPEGGRLKRMRTFKVHLATPCLYAALFGPVGTDHPMLARLVQSAVIGQWLASPDLERLAFVRLPEGTVDLVGLDAADGRPAWACALTGTDGPSEAVEALLRFARRTGPLRWVGATTLTRAALRTRDGVEVWHRPASQYAYEVGRRVAAEAGTP